MLNTEEKQKLVLDYLPLAHSYAWKKSRSSPKHITIDELKSAAYMGLVDYAYRFEGDKETFYPQARIQGEMLDYLRSVGWGPRGKKCVETNDFSDTMASPCVEFGSEEIDPDILKEVDDQSKDILVSRYVHGKKLKEISREKSLSIGRISQIIKESKKMLRKAA